MIIISLLGKSAQFSDTQEKPTTDLSNFLGMAKVLIQASEDMKIRFFKTSFESYDKNKDGFVTTNEFATAELEFKNHSFASLISWAMTEALNQFEEEHENGIDPTKIGIKFEDYKDALKKKLEQIYGKKN
jgi:Ca2+-binding EF-hand superfamily protein